MGEFLRPQAEYVGQLVRTLNGFRSPPASVRLIRPGRIQKRRRARRESGPPHDRRKSLAMRPPITSTSPDRSHTLCGRPAAYHTADAKQTVIAQADRQHRLGESRPRRLSWCRPMRASGAVPVHQAAVRLPRLRPQSTVPDIQHPHPGSAATQLPERMPVDVAIAACGRNTSRSARQRSCAHSSACPTRSAATNSGAAGNHGRATRPPARSCAARSSQPSPDRHAPRKINPAVGARGVTGTLPIRSTFPRLSSPSFHRVRPLAALKALRCLYTPGSRSGRHPVLNIGIRGQRPRVGSALT
jgi:hypothetical protein